MQSARYGACLAAFVLLAVPCLAGDYDDPAGSPSPRYARRWFYAMMNLQVKEQADRLIELIGRAKGAGYNGVVLADCKLNILDRGRFN